MPPLPKPLLWTVRKTFFTNKKAPPSRQAQTPTFEQTQRDDSCFFGCNRPPNREPGISITLLHPVFGRFVNDCKNVTPVTKDYAAAYTLRRRMCEFHGDEAKRRSQLMDILNEYGIDAQPGSIGSTECRTDGHIFTRSHPTLIIEVKNEIGWKGAEPTLEALAYYNIFCNEMKLWDDVSSCHPCFILCVAGKFPSSFCS